MKSILTILTAASLLALGGCATKTSSTSSCCAPGAEQKCSDGSAKCEADAHKGHTHAKTTAKKK